MEMNLTLSGAVQATAGVAAALTRKHFNACKLVVGTEFGTRFGLYEAQVHRMLKGISEVNRLAGSIKSEVLSWNFTTCSFVNLPKDKPDESMLAAAKSVELGWKTFDHMKEIASELATKNVHQPPAVKDKVLEINNNFITKKYEESLKEARILLAHASLASVVCNSKKKDDVISWPLITTKMQSYCKNTLGLNLQEDIVKEFAIKLGIISNGAAVSAATVGKPGKPTAKRTSGASAGSSSCSTAAPPDSWEKVSLSDTEKPKGPISKFRRRG